MHPATDLQTYAPPRKRAAGSAERADPITTQVVRHALISAANQMKRVLIRTSFSPMLYEGHDFAVAIYDREVRLLAQAPTSPMFLGTMGFCIEGAVEGVGGEAALEPGDVIVYNIPFGTGSHAQDMSVVTPAFRGDELVGYAVAKGHLVDIGAKDPYCSDTTDMFQEGLLLPGVKLYRRGVLVEDVMKIIQANSRMPSAVKGDVLAEVASCQAGAEELLRVIERFGMQTLLDCAERMYDHGEALVRDFITRIPEGRYRGAGQIDDDGIGKEAIGFEMELVVAGGEITFDLSQAPDAVKGPLNSPLPSTVSACRVVLAALAGNESPNEGYFRPLKIITRPGSMFHAVAPQPTYMYGWPLAQLMEAMFQAFAAAMPGRVPSGSAGDLCGFMSYAYDAATRELMLGTSVLPTGLGAFPSADGATLIHPAVGPLKLSSAELLETKCHLLQFERWEFETDSAGAGKYRGGLGVTMAYRLLRDSSFMTPIERTKAASWGQAGGLSGITNQMLLHYPDGRVVSTTKVTGLALPKGTLVEIRAGGGGGYGDPSERDPQAVLRDRKLGYISERKAREHYPQAFA